MSENVNASGRPLVSIGRILISAVIIILALSATILADAFVREKGPFGIRTIPKEYYWAAMAIPGLYVTWRSRWPLPDMIAAALVTPIIAILAYHVLFLMFMLGLAAAFGADVLYGGLIVMIASGVVATLLAGEVFRVLVGNEIVETQADAEKIAKPASAQCDASSPQPIEERLEQLRQLRDQGLVSEELYVERQRDLLREI